MRSLLLSTALVAVLGSLSAQAPVQFQGGGPDKTNPILITGPDTFLLSIDSLYGFNYDAAEDFYDEATDKVIWRNQGEGYTLRFGGNWRVPDSCPYAKFGIYTSVGNEVNFTRLGQEYSVAYHRGWEQFNEANIVGGGDSILTDSAGMLFLVIETGEVEIANLNILIQRTNGNTTSGGAAAPQFVELGSSSDLPLLNSGTAASPVDLEFESVTVQDPNWSVNVENSTLSYSGQPSYVDIKLNAKLFIADNANVQRANYMGQIVRINDGEIVAEAGIYIRDASDHEEDAWNISVFDLNPPVNPSYKVVYYRETSPTGLVSIKGGSVRFQVAAY